MSILLTQLLLIILNSHAVIDLPSGGALSTASSQAAAYADESDAASPEAGLGDGNGATDSPDREDQEAGRWLDDPDPDEFWRDTPRDPGCEDEDVDPSELTT